MAPEEKDASDNCHIYLICQRPAVAYLEESFQYHDGHIQGDIAYRLNGKQKTVSFRFPFPLLDGAIEVKLSPYPHREIHTLDEAGNIVRYLPANALCFGIEQCDLNHELRRFEVLYVGQAFADGKRSAFERLKSHSTLQKILAEAQYHAPDNEISLFMFEYAPYRIISQMDGRARETINDGRDLQRFYSIIENPLTEHQQVCLTEAALIRYFSPKYNEIYKESFPSQSHKILEQCYELDFSALVVEINTDELGFIIYSQRVSPNTHHMSQISLFDVSERLGFFHYSSDGDSYWEIPDVIR